jgi:hypothetical protein
MRPSTFLLLLLLLVPAIASAQTIGGTSHLPFDAPESWAMKYFSSATLFTGNGPPPDIKAGTFRIGVELGHLPELSTRQRTVGFGGTKVEDLNKLPVLVRPRLTVGLPGKFSVTVGIIPPFEISGVRPSLFALSVGRPIVSRGNFLLGARLYGQLGGIDGDFTCSREDVEGGDDRGLNPFGCEAPSQDYIEMRYAGAELGGSIRIVKLWNLTPHLLVAGNYLDNRFNVRARYSGVDDRTLLRSRGFTVSSAAGLTVPLGSHFAATAQVFYSPVFVRRPPGGERTADGLVNARFHLEWIPF